LLGCFLDRLSGRFLGRFFGHLAGIVAPNIGLIGNDGAIKATFRGRSRPAGRATMRIRFLWSTPPVRTSGNPPVKRRGGAKAALLPDFTGKCDARVIGEDASLNAVLLHCERRRIMV
jgi:hypothetical protein